MERSRQLGFTLLELAVVLLIIGLLAGGILAGEALIREGTLRKAASQIDEVRAALYTFRTKYGALPGDMAGSREYWPEAVDGDGNGEIEYQNADDIPESFNAWSHLSKAGLIRQPFAPVPALPASVTYELALSGVLPRSYLSIEYGEELYAAPAKPGTLLSLSGLPQPIVSYATGYVLWAAAYGTGGSVGVAPGDAQGLDQKLDDGRPFSGAITSVLPSLGADDESSCPLPGGANAYNIKSGYRNCMLVLRGQ